MTFDKLMRCQLKFLGWFVVCSFVSLALAVTVAAVTECIGSPVSPARFAKILLAVFIANAPWSAWIIKQSDL